MLFFASCLKEVTQELFCTKRFALEVCHLIDSCDASQYRSKTHCLQYQKKEAIFSESYDASRKVLRGAVDQKLNV